MNNLSLLFAIAGFLLVMGTWTWYMITIPRGKVPVWPIGSIILQALGSLVALIAIATLRFESLVIAILSIALAAFAIGMAGFFFWLLSQRQTPLGNIQVKVGDQIMPFSALTSDGEPFHTDQFDGKRVLLKFFRGGW